MEEIRGFTSPTDMITHTEAMMAERRAQQSEEKKLTEEVDAAFKKIQAPPTFKLRGEAKNLKNEPRNMPQDPDQLRIQRAMEEAAAEQHSVEVEQGNPFGLSDADMANPGQAAQGLIDSLSNPKAQNEDKTAPPSVKKAS